MRGGVGKRRGNGVGGERDGRSERQIRTKNGISIMKPNQVIEEFFIIITGIVHTNPTV